MLMQSAYLTAQFQKNPGKFEKFIFGQATDIFVDLFDAEKSGI